MNQWRRRREEEGRETVHQTIKSPFPQFDLPPPTALFPESTVLNTFLSHRSSYTPESLLAYFLYGQSLCQSRYPSASSQTTNFSCFQFSQGRYHEHLSQSTFIFFKHICIPLRTQPTSFLLSQRLIYITSVFLMNCAPKYLNSCNRFKALSPSIKIYI